MDFVGICQRPFRQPLRCLASRKGELFCDETPPDSTDEPIVTPTRAGGQEQTSMTVCFRRGQGGLANCNGR
jgi:hypothetical protein